MSDEIVLEEADPFVIEDNIVDVNCYGETTGSIVINVSGGTGELTFDWDSSELNTNQLINLGAGVYNVTIVDENGCNTSRSYTVEESSNIQVFLKDFSKVVVKVLSI